MNKGPFFKLSLLWNVRGKIEKQAKRSRRSGAAEARYLIVIGIKQIAGAAVCCAWGADCAQQHAASALLWRHHVSD